MRVLYVMWESFGGPDIEDEFTRRGIEIVKFWLGKKADAYENEDVQKRLIEQMKETEIDFAFSYNFFPVVSIACNACKVKYAAWIYDSPVSTLYHCSVVAPYNYIFMFDKTDYLEFKERGINTVYYLPLASAVERFDSYTMDEVECEIYSSPISFVGSTYSENRHLCYTKLCRLDDFSKGYVDGLVQAQKRTYGTFLLEEILTTDIVERLKEASPANRRPDTFLSFEKHYGQIILAKYVTSIERQEILEMLSEKYPVKLYTLKKTPSLPKIQNCGMAGNKRESTLIFRNSKINLNITLRCIRSGIPLRAFDVMGSGGFLLTNYQEDFLDFFEPGVDFAYYDSYEDLMEKVEYYLTHEEERAAIAKNGYEKMKKYHTYQVRMQQMLDIMQIEE